MFVLFYCHALPGQQARENEHEAAKRYLRPKNASKPPAGQVQDHWRRQPADEEGYTEVKKAQRRRKPKK